MTETKGHEKLQNQPLSVVLAEFRFSEVLKMADHIPDIQEQVRRTYPVFQHKQAQEIKVEPTGISIGQSIIGWSFANQEGTTAFDIEKNRLIFVSTYYDRFESFAELCLEPLTILKRIVEPALFYRIALRYNDLIAPEPGEDLSAYIDPVLLPPQKLKEFGNPIHNRTETFFETEFGAMGCRTLVTRERLAVMPDLAALPISVRVNTSESDFCAILDFDHFFKDPKGVPFELDFARDRLNKLHAVSVDAFWRITTDKAKEKWR